MIIRAVAAAVAALVLCGGCIHVGPLRTCTWTVTLCQGSVPTILVEGYANFSVTLDFRLLDGIPHEVQVRDNPLGVPANELIECVRTWRLGGVNDDTTGQATFRWRHGVGWDRLSLQIGTEHQVITLPTSRTPVQ